MVVTWWELVKSAAKRFNVPICGGLRGRLAKLVATFRCGTSIGSS